MAHQSTTPDTERDVADTIKRMSALVDYAIFLWVEGTIFLVG